MISNNEIINRFDVLYNNTMSNQAPSLDAYEMSVFFNKAQLEILKNHLNSKGNKYGEGFDGSSKRQLDFSNLIVTQQYVFSYDEIKGDYNKKAFCFNGIEEITIEEKTRYIVKEIPSDSSEYIDPDDPPQPRIVINTTTVEEQTAEIKEASWPTNILSVINESLEILTLEEWRNFAFYMSKFLKYDFLATDEPFITNLANCISWILSFGFEEDDPIAQSVKDKLQDAIYVVLDYKGPDAPLTSKQILDGIGFGETKSYDDALSELGFIPNTITVVPINNVEYDTLTSRPYKFPPKSQAWRMISGNKVEFLTSPVYHPLRYIIRYVKIPKEIDLSNNNDVPEIPEVLIDEVIQRAVELAKNAWEGNIETTKALGERSE